MGSRQVVTSQGLLIQEVNFKMNKLIALVFIQNFVSSQIQIPPKNNLALFNNMMRDLFNNCRAEFRTIGFWGHDQIFPTDDKADIVLLNKNEMLKEPSTRRIKFLVAILGEFNPDPEKTLFEVMPTLEIETMFVFDKNNSNEKSMDSIFDWFQNRFENSKFYYCTATEGKIDIVTFNTFADVAPAFWAKIGEVQFPDDDGDWSIFKAEYTENTKYIYGSELCENIIFDRTKKLHGYKIKVSAKLQNFSEPKLVVLNDLITKDTDVLRVTSMLFPMQGLFSKFLTNYLDVSVNITHGMPLYRGVDTSVMIMDGTLDLGLTPTHWIAKDRFFKFSTYFHLPCPSLFYYNIIVTHNREMSPLEKIFEFYGWLTIIVTLIIIFIAFIVIYLLNSESNSSLSFTVFECLRLLIGSSIYTRMDSDNTRIVFSVIFLYFLIIQATFFGHLAAFLTKPAYRKNVETLKDLKDPYYTAIYSHVGGQSYITDPVLLNKTKFGDFECGDYINDTSIACIDAKSNLKYLVAEYNLHTPRNFIKFSYASLTMRHNWALRHRVNNLIMRLAQSGITEFWEKKFEQPLHEKLKRKHDIEENFHRPISVADVMFAFILLSVGLFSAFLSFVVEYLLEIFTTINMFTR
ncbi:GSCOCG00007166001-RA-CDS [Cotesia congregata]|uniref:Ionotropic glutamate receptor C-terminal domain-containing protein n=1 Tax=Cotesia congregata TaxID=51543 RepID=A0A8J2HD76_COTCN|nr:GSCOCG00007166001-RA-CDS [Cotesia congregata]CAG5092821.1 Protein of unknown function [Cotesia congregata]